MNTWNEADPPVLAPVTRGGRILGGARVAVIVLLTIVALGLFLAGRGLRALLGRWIVFHFGVARLWSRICLRLCGLRLVVHGTPVGSGAIVANHSSWIDILALRSVRLIYFVSKAEVAAWPGVGFIARVTGTVFIERRRTEAKRQEAVLRERIGAGQLLCLFPEATSTDGRRVLPFKSALFSAFYAPDGPPIAVQPVTIAYTPRPGMPRDLYGWWGSMSFEGHIWDVVTRSTGGIVTVTFHDPMDTIAIPDRKEMARRAGETVATGLAKTGRDA